MNENFDQVAKIKVFGVGGGGGNAVNRMVNQGVLGVEFYLANTDSQVLNTSPVANENKILIGRDTTKGLGAGGNPELGRAAAIEDENSIREKIKGTDMVFIAAGLGGGTGTGAAPIIAKIAKEEGALVLGIVTTPFSFEGRRRKLAAEKGMKELREYIDSLIIVSNNNLLEVIGKRPISEAFQEADNVLRQGVQTITDLIAVPAEINLDFADVRTIMENRGSALIGIGMADGEDRARKAAEKAIQSPLLEAKIHGASAAIVNITGGESVTLYDAEDAMELIRQEAGSDIDAIFGVAINENLGDSIIVTVIATGYGDNFEEEEEVEEVQPVIPTVKAVAPQQEPAKDFRATYDEDDEEDSIPRFAKNR